MNSRAHEDDRDPGDVFPLSERDDGRDEPEPEEPCGRCGHVPAEGEPELEAGVCAYCIDGDMCEDCE